MFGKLDAEVLVVGAGPVGLVTGLLLAERGIKVALVDQEQRTGAHNYALALHPASLKLFNELGLLSALRARGRQVDTVGLWDGKSRKAEMRLKDVGGEFPSLLVLSQAAVEDVVEQRLKQKGVEVLWNHRVAQVDPSPNGVTVNIEKLGMASGGYPIASTVWMVEKAFDLTPAFVIGADGHHSVVRRRLDIPFQRVGDPLAFAVAEFQTDMDLGSEVRIIFHEGTTNVCWPLPDQRCRWSFQIQESDIPETQGAQGRLAVRIGERAFPYLPEPHLQEFLKARAPWFTGGTKDVRWSMAVRFERGLAERLGKDRAWLVGDAGHMSGPAGVHSMNLGLLEAQDLAGRMTKVLRHHAGLDALNGYNDEHLKTWRFLLGQEGGLTTSASTDPFVAKNLERLMPCIPASGKDLETLAKQIGLGVKHG